MLSMLCPLCNSRAYAFLPTKQRAFYRCEHCDLVFADPTSHLPLSAEQDIYDLHQNDPSDSGYRQFLMRLVEPLVQYLGRSATHYQDQFTEVLDFGCGPGPAMGELLEPYGLSVCNYDPIYQPNDALLQKQFDVITCTEVVEHFNQPLDSWQQLFDCLSAKGTLGVMTSLFTRDTPAAFNAWQYKNDPTHVSFYTPKTIAWLSDYFKVTATIVSQRVILFTH